MRLVVSVIVLVAIIQSCSSIKDIFQKGEFLEVKKIAVQKVVPGMPKPPPYDQLLVQVELSDSELMLDSVYFQHRVYYFKSTSTNELTLKHSKASNDTNYIGEPVSAFLFYHIKDKHYYQSYDEVVRLQDLVMP